MTTLLPLAASYTFPQILMLLIWVAFGVLNLWIWQKGKAQGNLLMMIGGFVFAFAALMWLVSDFPSEFIAFWCPVIASGLILAGFYLTSAKLIEAQMAGIKAKLEKLKDATSEDGGSGDDA